MEDPQELKSSVMKFLAHVPYNIGLPWNHKPCLKDLLIGFCPMSVSIDIVFKSFQLVLCHLSFYNPL